MQPKSTLEILKFAGGAIIVLAAVAIMMPGVVSFLMGLGRIALYISILLTLGVIVSFVLRQIRRRSGQVGSNVPEGDTSAENSSSSSDTHL